ncbi:response regulator [Pseudemcibacter aquimaris]|uniref:response regulator n=1 Tax=Pseudemcibacter aquimaris TaxID=2857064 RepID=UPI002011578D|nr:response regulator [Pseudemcibacter aquimaris]MCC3860794.1 response regulator [Pseudemcibacter aquimaris]WDU59614.1 response regulator [Pseudemcibacter aquimaris]
MSGIDLSRISVLVVEDSPFVRSLLVNSIRVLGVQSVRSVDDGAEAIEFLKLVDENPMKAGMMSVDVIISDWEMSPVNGLMLLRWIRRHKESSDRFKPFIMLTGYSEPKRVQEAREMGVTEFMSKPFSVNALADKFYSIIFKQRQFVHTNSYFGPDRRRQVIPISGEDRRKFTYDSPEVEVVNV